MKHNFETYASFLIFCYYLCILHLFKLCQSTVSSLPDYIVAFIFKMSNLLIQGVVISGNHADNFRKWDSTLTGVLNDPYGQFLGRFFVSFFVLS